MNFSSYQALRDHVDLKKLYFIEVCGNLDSITEADFDSAYQIRENLKILQAKPDPIYKHKSRLHFSDISEKSITPQDFSRVSCNIIEEIKQEAPPRVKKIKVKMSPNPRFYDDDCFEQGPDSQ